MELCIGTVQFGMQYGARKAQVSKQDAVCILKDAAERNICYLDTAPGYGEAEKLLGDILCSEKLDFKVITKYFNADQEMHKNLHISIEKSLFNLKKNSLDACLFHRAEYLSDTALKQDLAEVKREGLVEHIGVSIYTPQEAFAAIESEDMDYVQVPYNILDTRLKEAGFFEKAERAGKKIFVRSIFLQGVFMLPQNLLPVSIREKVWTNIRKVQEECRRLQVPIECFLIAFIKQTAGIHGVLLGVENYRQYQNNVASYFDDRLSTYDFERFQKSLDTLSEEVLNPALWR